MSGEGVGGGEGECEVWVWVCMGVGVGVGLGVGVGVGLGLGLGVAEGLPSSLTSATTTSVVTGEVESGSGALISKGETAAKSLLPPGLR